MAGDARTAESSVSSVTLKVHRDRLVIYAPKSPSLILEEACLVPGYLRQKGKLLGNSLGRLEIKNCNVSSHHHEPRRVQEVKIFRELVDLLRRSPDLEVLNLAGLFPRNQSDVSDLASILKYHRNLQELVLVAPGDAEVNFGKGWVSVLDSNNRLQSLSLKAFSLDSSMESLVDAINQVEILQELRLSHCTMNDWTLWKLAKGLEYMKSIKLLQLVRCRFLTNLSLLVLASVINWNSDLQAFDLSGNPGLFQEQNGEGKVRFADQKAVVKLHEAASMFALSLRENTILVELRLCQCGITDEVFLQILEALEQNSGTLQDLNLNENLISHEVGVAQHLLAALPNLSLRHIGLLGLKSAATGNDDVSRWSTKQLYFFLVSLKQNNTLVKLELDPTKHDRAISEVLQRNMKLQASEKMNSSNNTVVELSGQQNRESAADKNKNLSSLWCGGGDADATASKVGNNPRGADGESVGSASYGLKRDIDHWLEAMWG